MSQEVVVYRKENVYYDLASDINFKFKNFFIKYLIDDGHMVTVVWESKPMPQGAP